MYVRRMQSTALFALVRERLEALSREIGMLLLAFTPLDAVLWGERQDRTQLVLTFVLAAIGLITVSFLSETRRIRG